MLSHRRFAAVAGICLLALAAPAARAQTPPTVRYAPESGSRTLLFTNNPEQIVVNYTDPNGVVHNDLADPGLGQKSILRASVPAGVYRNFFEHLNHNAGTIHYGVQVYNPNSVAVTVTVRGKGFTTGRFGDASRPVSGGQPFVDALTTRTATVYTLNPGRADWIFRSDRDYSGARPILNGDFFSGVVEFDVSGGPVFVTNLAYRNFASLTSWSYMGFVTRQPANPNDAPESRVYKGTMGGGVLTTLSFSVNDATPTGDLAVQYPRYVNDGSGTFVPGATVTGPNYHTHDLPWRENSTSTALVVANDMSDIAMPGFGTVRALQPTPVPGSPYPYANLGNWGVTYHQKVTVANGGTRSRNFQLRLGTASGGGGPIAYRGSDGVWRQWTLGGGVFPYFTGSVPANSTRTYDAYFILGGPAVGRLRHSLNLTN